MEGKVPTNDRPKTVAEVMIGRVPDRFRRLNLRHPNGRVSNGGLVIKWHWSHTKDGFGTYTGICGHNAFSDPCPKVVYDALALMHHKEEKDD